VLHCKGDRVAPVEEGRHMARIIPGASFVELPGNIHALLEGTPAFEQFFNEVTTFLAMHNQKQQRLPARFAPGQRAPRQPSPRFFGIALNSSRSPKGAGQSAKCQLRKSA
jgi:hypothetical protein